MAALGLTPLTAAKAAGLPRDTFRNMFRDNGSYPRADTLVKMAEALQTTVAYLVGEAASPQRGRLEPVRPDKGGGYLNPIPVLGDLPLTTSLSETGVIFEETEKFLLIEVPGFETSDLSAYTVGDVSMENVFKPGVLAITAHIDSTGLRAGDFAVVGKGNASKEPIEIMLRELVCDDGVYLFRATSHPERYDDIQFSRLDGDETVSVLGVVVAQLGLHATPMLGRVFPIAARREPDQQGTGGD